MTLTLALHHPSFDRRPALFRLRDLAIGRLRHVWLVWQRRRRRARDLAELAGMDDRLLRDIGLTRFDIVALGAVPPRRAEDWARLATF